MDNAIGNMKSVTQTCHQAKMFGVVSVEEMKKEKVDTLTFTQTMHQCHNQMSLKMGIKNVEMEQWKTLKKIHNNCT